VAYQDTIPVIPPETQTRYILNAIERYSYTNLLDNKRTRMDSHYTQENRDG
jgi:hypothetical protein